MKLKERGRRRTEAYTVFILPHQKLTCAHMCTILLYKYTSGRRRNQGLFGPALVLPELTFEK